MAANLNITLRSLIGASKFIDYDPSENPMIDYPAGDESSMVKELSGGALKIIKRRRRRAVTLLCDPVDNDDAQTLAEAYDSHQDLCISPPWDADALAYLGLQGGLGDMREEDTASEVTFARASKRANSVTGKWVGFDEPLYENGGVGKGLSVSDVVNDAHEPSYQVKRYMTADASDSGSITIVTVGDVTLYYVGQYVMVSTEGQSPNTLEVARIDAIENNGTGTLDLAQTAASDAVLTNTSSYTVANRTYVQGWNLVSDGEMDESGTASWANASGGAPSLAAKSSTQQETGTRCMRLIGNGDTTGIQQSIGAVPAGTDLYIMARVKVIRGTLLVNVRDDTNTADNAEAAVGGGAWEWVRFAMESERGGSGQNTIILKFTQSGATTLEALIDRVEIFKNELDNGGMEGTYVSGVAPGWAQAGTPTPAEETSLVHAGSSAQKLTNGDTAGNDVRQTTVPVVSGVYYQVGGYAHRVSGVDHQIRFTGAFTALNLGGLGTTGQYDLLQGITTGASTGLGSVVLQGQSASASVSIFDDIFVRRLPGNPYDDAYYDLPEPLATDGFLVAFAITLDATSTSAGQVLLDFSRRTFAGSDRVYFTVATSGTTATFNVTTASTNKQATAAITPAIGETLWVIGRCTGAGAMKLWAKAGSDAAVTETQTGATIADGLTRAWLRYGGSYSFTPRGTHSSILIENTGDWTDAQVEALLDRLSDPTWLKHIRKVDGIKYRMDPLPEELYHGQATHSKVRLTLRERQRDDSAVIAIQD